MLKTFERQRRQIGEKRRLYYSTNENLRAIIAGLTPKIKDVILCVGGSGDQAFALLENAGEIHVVDNSPLQIDLIEERVERLRKEDYQGFLEIPSDASDKSRYFNTLHAVGFRDEYFEDLTRLNKLRERLDRLTIYPASDIFRFATDKSGFTKIYLSNALEYHKPIEEFSSDNLLERIRDNLPLGGLIYISESSLLESRYSVYMNKFMGVDYTSMDMPGFLPEGVIVDQKRTNDARRLERAMWSPLVMKKILRI